MWALCHLFSLRVGSHPHALSLGGGASRRFLPSASLGPRALIRNLNQQAPITQISNQQSTISNRSIHPHGSPIVDVAQLVLGAIELEHRHRAGKQLIAPAGAKASWRRPGVGGVEERF